MQRWRSKYRAGPPAGDRQLLWSRPTRSQQLRAACIASHLSHVAWLRQTGQFVDPSQLLNSSSRKTGRGRGQPLQGQPASAKMSPVGRCKTAPLHAQQLPATQTAALNRDRSAIRISFVPTLEGDLEMSGTHNELYGAGSQGGTRSASWQCDSFVSSMAGPAMSNGQQQVSWQGSFVCCRILEYKHNRTDSMFQVHATCQMGKSRRQFLRWCQHQEEFSPAAVLGSAAATILALGDFAFDEGCQLLSD